MTGIQKYCSDAHFQLLVIRFFFNCPGAHFNPLMMQVEPATELPSKMHYSEQRPFKSTIHGQTK